MRSDFRETSLEFLPPTLQTTDRDQCRCDLSFLRRKPLCQFLSRVVPSPGSGTVHRAHLESSRSKFIRSSVLRTPSIHFALYFPIPQGFAPPEVIQCYPIFLLQFSLSPRTSSKISRAKLPSTVYGVVSASSQCHPSFPFCSPLSVAISVYQV